MTYQTQGSRLGRQADDEIATLRSQLAEANAEATSAIAAAETAETAATALRLSVTNLESEVADLTERLTDAETALAECREPAAPSSTVRVNIHSTWRNTQYADDAKVIDATKRLGATGVRDFLGLTKDRKAVLSQYRDAGLPVHLAIGHYSKSVEADKPKYIAALLEVVDCVDSVAGFNEPDAGGVARSVWLPKAAAWHNWLWGAVKSHPDLKHLLVLPGALMGKDDSPDDTAAYAAALDGFDRWNAHWYPGNVPNVEAAYLARKATWPGPTWITEFGGNVNNISQETASRNLTEIIRLHNGPGEAAFIYQLLNTASDADDFAMFDATWAPTASGQAVIEALS